jgi:hypothetical protein
MAASTRSHTFAHQPGRSASLHHSLCRAKDQPILQHLLKVWQPLSPVTQQSALFRGTFLAYRATNSDNKSTGLFRQQQEVSGNAETMQQRLTVWVNRELVKEGSQSTLAPQMRNMGETHADYWKKLEEEQGLWMSPTAFPITWGNPVLSGGRCLAILAKWPNKNHVPHAGMQWERHHTD